MASWSYLYESTIFSPTAISKNTPNPPTSMIPHLCNSIDSPYRTFMEIITHVTPRILNRASFDHLSPRRNPIEESTTRETVATRGSNTKPIWKPIALYTKIIEPIKIQLIRLSPSVAISVTMSLSGAVFTVPSLSTPPSALS